MNWLDKWTLCLHATGLALRKNPHVKEKCERRLVQHEPSTDTLIGYDKLLLLLLWSPPHSPHSLMWDQLHIQLDNHCNFQSQEIGIRRGSCSDSWLYLSFCLLIDAFFILGTLQTLAEKFLESPEGTTTLSNRIFSWIKGGPFWKEECPHSGRRFALFNLEHVHPHPPIWASKRVHHIQCIVLITPPSPPIAMKKQRVWRERPLKYHHMSGSLWMTNQN